MLCSLPHRQLRKRDTERVWNESGSLPHRQLRNDSQRLSPDSQRSLPHRQLRKPNGTRVLSCPCSLPHRQLRNCRYLARFPTVSSLPHRQLRKRCRACFQLFNRSLPYSHHCTWQRHHISHSDTSVTACHNSIIGINVNDLPF